MKKTASAAALVLALALAGCQSAPQTPEELIARSQAALAETPCTAAACTMDMAMKLDLFDTDVEMRVAVEEAITANADPAMYTLETGTVEMLGQTIPIRAQTYIVPEGDAYARYTLAENSWTRQALADGSDAVLAADFPTQDLAMDAGAEYNGSPVYRLTGTLRGPDLLEGIGTALEGDAVDSAGLADVVADAVLYLDAETFRPVHEELVLRGLAEALVASFTAQIGIEDMGDAGVSVSEGELHITVDFTSYEAGEAIVLPADAANAAPAE